MGLSKDWFVFDGTDSRDFGVHLFEKETLGAPARRVERISIPGRSGDLVIDEGAFENKTLRYSALIIDSAMDGLISLKNFLLSRVGYVRLEDSFNRDEYYMARLDGGIDVQTTRQRDAVKLVLEFDREPQRWLKIGEEAKEFTGSGSLENPTWQIAQPLVRIYGNGTVTINGYQVTTANNSSGYIDVDCRAEDCYNGTTNRNGDVTLVNHKFPRLGMGANAVSKTSGITKIVVTPRWYTL